MLTKNGKTLFFINNTNSRVPSGTYYAQDWSGNYSNGNYNLMKSFLERISLVVGNGTSLAKSTDYNMSMINTLTVLNSTGSNYAHDYDCDSGYAAFFTKTFKNDTDSDITVTEVGLYANNNKDYLFAREVIDPIVIHPQEIYTFSMYIG